MPGILPMKVIKVGGTGAQSRIAQACDRCRSKKIRCDGVRPCCSQCANVGFECKTSDKLSRRAFPRGYTESLEERVRALESEVRDLKDLLDEKDEKLDVLSRIHSFSPPSQRAASARSPSTTTTDKSTPDDAEGVIHVQRTKTQSSPSQPSSNPYTALSTIQGFAGMYSNLRSARTATDMLPLRNSHRQLGQPRKISLKSFDRRTHETIGPCLSRHAESAY